jgi:hypothetical protein
MSAYLLIQLGHATFGTGDTPDAARADAAQWLDRTEELTAAEIAAAVPLMRGAAQVLSRCVDGDLVVVDRETADALGNY